MTDDEPFLDHLAAFGLRPRREDLPAIRAVLEGETERERAAYDLSRDTVLDDYGDTELMQLCCVQLFNCGDLADTLLIWRAKRTSMDSDGAIDVQLLCGSGLDQTKAYLSGDGSADALAALSYLMECEAARDFDGFSVQEYASTWKTYYGLNG